jgi:beta-galactosidase
VYSNAAEVELFVNGKSQGVKKRDSQDFPAAGLRWLVPLAEGENILRAVARQGKTTVQDEIRQRYQTAKWGKPTRLTLSKTSDANGMVTIEAQLLDAQGVPCLDAANWVQFGLTGGGTLLDDLGTSSGSRKVQAYNGRALIRLRSNGLRSVASVSSEGMPAAFLTL